MLDGPPENKAIDRPDATEGDGPEVRRSTATLKLWRADSRCPRCGVIRWRSGDDRQGCGCGEAGRDHDDAEPIADAPDA